MLYVGVFACVCKSVHDSLMVGVERAAALHAKVTPEAAGVSMQQTQEKDTTVGWRSWINVPLADSNTPSHAPHPTRHLKDFFQSFQLHLMDFIRQVAPSL